MSMEIFEQVPTLLPIEFFNLSAEISYAKALPTSRKLRLSHLLPDTSEWLGEERFAEVAMVWNGDGLCIEAYVDKPFEEANYPHYKSGDALEIFIDTRDLKTAGFATRFCHHFMVLPEAVQGVQALEVTHFRTEDTHPLCDPSELVVTATFHQQSYSLRLVIPAQCLAGYDPQTCDKMGFMYRMHRYGGPPQHFTVSSDHFSIEQSPRLWASLAMIRK